MYGIDLISIVNGKFDILLSVENITDDWVPLCRFVQWVNIMNVPPMLFQEVLDVFHSTENIDIDADQMIFEPELLSQIDYNACNIRDKNTQTCSRVKKYSFGFSRDVVERICRILECRPEELLLPEEL